MVILIYRAKQYMKGNVLKVIYSSKHLNFKISLLSKKEKWNGLMEEMGKILWYLKFDSDPDIFSTLMLDRKILLM